MHAKEVIESVLKNHPKEGWFIYRYNLTQGILGLLFRLLYVVIFTPMALILFFKGGQDGLFYAILLGVVAFGGLYATIMQIITLMYSKTSMIVLTDHSIIKNFKNKTEEYPYSKISGLNMHNVSGGLNSPLFMPKYYIEFTDEQTGRSVQLAHNRMFGSANEIFSVLQSKLS